jgi:hypothetical protein
VTMGDAALIGDAPLIGADRHLRPIWRRWLRRRVYCLVAVSDHPGNELQKKAQ